MTLCVRRLPEDGSPVPKYELCFVICILLYFIKCTYWKIYRIILYIRISISSDTIKYISLHPDLSVWYEGCNFNSGNYLFTTDTK